ncbi:MAG TPA: hypothetical protein VIM68_03835 [Thermoanaerobaculia bacterium]
MPVVSVPIVAFVFSVLVQPKANSASAATVRTARDFFMRFSPRFHTKTPCRSRAFSRINTLDQCFLVVVFFVVLTLVVPVVIEPVSVLPMVVVPVVPDVVVDVVAVIAVPDVSEVVPDGIAAVSVVPVVLDIAVPDVSLVVIVDDVSLAAVSVTFVFSSFLQANANSATARTIEIAKVLFIQLSPC